MLVFVKAQKIKLQNPLLNNFPLILPNKYPSNYPAFQEVHSVLLYVFWVWNWACCCRSCLCLWPLRWSVWLGRWRPVSWGRCACRWQSQHFIIARLFSSTHWRISAFQTTLNPSQTASLPSGSKTSTASSGECLMRHKCKSEGFFSLWVTQRASSLLLLS